MVEGGEYRLFLGEEEGHLYIFLLRGGICPRRVKIAWLRERVKLFQSSRSTLIFATAETFPFTEPSVLGFLYTSMERRKGIHVGEDGIHAGHDGIHAGIKLYHLYNHNLARFSLVNRCQVIWKLAVIGHCPGASLCLGGRGNALALHACQVRTLSTSRKLDSHALSHALSVVAITWLILQEKGRTDWLQTLHILRSAMR